MKLLLIFCCISFLSLGYSRTILVVESYHSEYAWDKSYLKGLRDTIGGGHKIVTYQMNTKRIAKSKFPDAANNAYKHILATKPDVVVLGDDNALKLLSPKLIDSTLPVVYLGINSNPRRYGVFGKKNFTGVLERPLFKSSLLAMKRLVGVKAKKCLILFDSGNTSLAAVDEAFHGKRKMTIFDVEVDLRTVSTLREWKSQVSYAKKNGYDFIIMGLYHTIVDEKGKHVPAPKIVKWTSENATVPPFAFWDFAVGKDKAVGGLVLFGESQGIAAGKMVNQLLEGVSPSQIQVQIGKKGRYFFSSSELEKWKIKLPEDIKGVSEVTN
jgi:ABC-type uncharacterized transport system substrate-binding protein